MINYPVFAEKRAKVLTISTIVIGLILILAIMLRLAIPGLVSESVASGIVSSASGNHLGECPDTPNCQNSESSRPKQQVERFVLTLDAEQAIQTMAGIIESQPGAAVIEQTSHYLHATFATRIMGYIDDVEFLLSDDSLSLQVRSASRLGVSDLRVNARRIATLRKLAAGRL